MIKWHFYKAWMALELGYLHIQAIKQFLVLLAMFMNLRKAQKSIKDLTISVCVILL